jgi:hypothetical protein
VRDIWLSKAGLAQETFINREKAQELSSLGERCSVRDLEQSFAALMQAYTYLEQNINLKLVAAYLTNTLVRR